MFTGITTLTNCGTYSDYRGTERINVSFQQRRKNLLQLNEIMKDEARWKVFQNELWYAECGITNSTMKAVLRGEVDISALFTKKVIVASKGPATVN